MPVKLSNLATRLFKPPKSPIFTLHRPLHRPITTTPTPTSSTPTPFQKYLQDNTGISVEEFRATIFSKLNPVPGTATDNNPEEPPTVFKKMRDTGLVPNAVAMVDGLLKDGLSKEAMKLFQSMRDTGTIPEVVVYTAVVEGFCEMGRFEDAISVFRKMERSGVVPNAYSYGVLVRGLLGGGGLEGCVGFCLEMVEAGHGMNVGLFVGVVGGLCEDREMEEVRGVVRRLRERGFAVDDKGVREYLEKNRPVSRKVWEVIFGKESARSPSAFLPIG